MMTEKKKGKKKGLVIGIIAGLLGMSIAYSVGVTSVKTDIKDTKYDYNELVDLYNSTVDDLKKENAKLEDKKEEVKEAMALVEQRDEMVEKISKTNKEVDEKRAESSSLDDEIKSKQDELSKIEKGIKEKEDDPIQLNAGEYIVGQDVPTGRYRVTNIGRGTNFQVFDSSGSAVVNTILGNGDIGRGDYVFFATENTLIKTAGAVKMIPVE
jgi:hypothetical protein